MRDMSRYEDSDQFAEDYCKETINNIKRIMEEKDIPQGALAVKSGLGQSTVSKFLAGDTRVSLIHVAKICKALDVEPGKVFPMNREKIDPDMGDKDCGGEESEMLIYQPGHPAFKGYLRDFKIYFDSTISSENKILQGDLSFRASGDGRYCVAKLVLDTGKRKDGKPVEKCYMGKLVISLSLSACYCILTANDIGEICFLVFNHMFLFHEELICRLACAATVSSGGNKRPTMHRLLISREELNVENSETEDFKFLKGQLLLNSSDIVIEKKAYEKMNKLESDLLKSNTMRELLDEFEQDREILEVYQIDESKLRNADYPVKEKVQLISLLREYSISSRYNKISTKADEHIYNYFENRS